MINVFNQLIKYLKKGHRISLASILCLLAVYATAHTIFYSRVDYTATELLQTPVTNKSAQQQPSKKTGRKLVELKAANEIQKRENFEPQILIDSVILYHDGAYLFCDSAYYDDKQNSFEAFSNVRMEQGDTLFLYGNYMLYDGNTKMVMVRENVRLENIPQNVTLFTDSLNYDRVNNIGYYFDGGMLIDSIDNKLTSYWGQYEPNINLATFIDSVVLLASNATLYSDTLKYNTQTKTALIVSPTTILSDSGTILTDKGWYNTVTDEALLLNQSTVQNKVGDRILRGDSIFYNKAKGYGEVFGNMFLQDTTNHIILRGNYGFYDEKSDYSFATDSAYSIEYSQGDSLYLHADTLKLISIVDTVEITSKQNIKERTAIPGVSDSIVGDSLDSTSNHPVAIKSLSDDSGTAVTTEYRKFRELKAYHGVRFYRSDLQGVCDSMQFNSRDSILYLYKDPVLWNEKNQISGDTIVIFMNDSTIDYVHVRGYSFSIEEKDSVNFNQIKGRSLKAFFEGKKVRRILVEGNAESIFYPQEDTGNFVGLNWLESSYLEVFLKDGKLDKLKTWPKSTGKMTPMELIAPDQRRLKDFFWYDYLKPLDKNDIFRKVSKKATDIKPKRSAIFDRED